MPPVVTNVLQTKVDAIRQDSINRVILATAIWAETNSLYRTPDTRPDEVKEFELAVARNGGITNPVKLLAQKVYSHEIRNVDPGKTVKPVFHAAFVVEKPYGHVGDLYGSVPFGTTLLTVSSKKGSYRDAAGKLYHISLNSNYLRPANDDEVAAVVNGLFSVRPALTVKLFANSAESDNPDEQD